MMIRQRIIGRLRYLRNLEILNIISVPTSLFIVMSQLTIAEWRMMVYTIVVMTFIFFQGALYWDIKHNSIIQRQTKQPITFHTNFRTLQWFNIVLLLLYPIFSIYGNLSANPFFLTDWWSHSVFIATVIVYINYYHWQVSHDNPTDIRYLLTHQMLRRSPLHTDLHPISVIITKPIHTHRASITSRRIAHAQHTSTTESTFGSTHTSRSTQTHPSSPSQPISIAKSQPVPTLTSSHSQPLPTAKSQPIPTLTSSHSQPLPTVPPTTPNDLATSITQPLPIVDDETILNIVWNSSQEQDQTVIKDSALAEQYSDQPDNTKKAVSTKRNTGSKVTRTPMKSSQESTDTAKPKKTARSRSKNNPSND